MVRSEIPEHPGISRVLRTGDPAPVFREERRTDPDRAYEARREAVLFGGGRGKGHGKKQYR